MLWDSQYAPDYTIFSYFPGEAYPPSTSAYLHPYRATACLKNADQIYTYLMKLKLNTRIGLIAIIKRLFTVTKNKYFHFVYKNSSLSCSSEKKTAPLPYQKKTNDLSLILKKKSSEHSSIPTIPGTALAF